MAVIPPRVGRYLLVTDGNSMNTRLFRPDGTEVWGVKEVELKLVADQMGRYHNTAILRRYVPYPWADLNEVGSMYKINEDGSPTILEETLRGVEIIHPSMRPPTAIPA